MNGFCGCGCFALPGPNRQDPTGQTGTSCPFLSAVLCPCAAWLPVCGSRHHVQAVAPMPCARVVPSRRAAHVPEVPHTENASRQVRVATVRTRQSTQGTPALGGSGAGRGCSGPRCFPCSPCDAGRSFRTRPFTRHTETTYAPGAVVCVDRLLSFSVPLNLMGL